jgi:8-oxo-dGTP pyrophosphatase MutT (NUDIX family)
MKEIYTFDRREIKNKIKPNRYATRAVIFKDNKILLLYLNTTNEYKFPGGGLEANETFEEALIRECREEAGVNVAKIIDCIGYIDQIYPDIHDNSKTYYMRSIYYLCEIEDNFFSQELSNQEAYLGFQPKWVSLDEAIETNEIRLLNGSNHHWTKRELKMFKYLKEMKKSSN